MLFLFLNNHLDWFSNQSTIIGTADVKFTSPDCWLWFDDPGYSSPFTSLEA